MAARGGLFEVASVVADGRSSSGRARSEPRQKYVASSRHERHRASSVPDARTETLILLSCVHLHLRGERDIFMLKWIRIRGGGRNGEDK